MDLESERDRAKKQLSKIESEKHSVAGPIGLKSQKIPVSEA